MKKITLLLLFCGISIALMAQRHFTAQAGIFLNAQSQDFDGVRDLGFVYAEVSADNVYRVFVGGYDNQADADKVTATLRQRGYGNAVTMEMRLSEGRNLPVIQLATRDAGKAIEWEKLQQVGDLYGTATGDKIKITTAPYANIEAAKRELNRIQQMGYKDAFVRNVNSTTLFAITSFETGVKKPLIPLVLDKQPPKRTAQQQQPASRITPVDVPQSYEESGRLTVKTPYTNPPATAAVAEKKAERPAIRSNIKRRSALELQKILKAEGYYSSSVDGFYGSGTAKAYETAKQSNRELRKYTLLGQLGETEVNDRLQQAINNLHSDPSAIMVLESSTTPIAQAYRAYLLFTQLGADNEVNRLMNNAIKATYGNRPFKTQPPFDYRATYAYQDLDQLIMHLYYIHCAPDHNYSVPCWMNERYPRQSGKATAAAAAFPAGEFRLKACDPLSQWEEIQTMLAIASDMNSGKKAEVAKTSLAATQRSQLLTTTKSPAREEQRLVENWNQQVWDGLNIWAAKDPLHQQMVTAFKIAYFQSQVRLEDYFMDKGFQSEEAKILALQMLQALVGIQLERFG